MDRCFWVVKGLLSNPCDVVHIFGGGEVLRDYEIKSHSKSIVTKRKMFISKRKLNLT